MRLSFLPLLVALLASAGCVCVFEPEVCGSQSGLGIPEEPNETPAIATAGCDENDVRASDNGVVCASCDFVDAPGLGTAEICGQAAVAPCESRENSFGEACQLCVVPDSGEILYDDCFAAVADTATVCEDVNDLVRAETCHVCFDASGAQVTNECGPLADRCDDVVDDAGRSCRVCEKDGVVVSRACDAVDVDPSFCQAYANDAGRCVDCHDERGALLTHSCTGTASAARTCEATVSPEGLACTVCVDDAGTTVLRDCGETATATTCELLAFSEQSCVVCVDGNNALTLVNCTRNDCAVSDAACRSDADCAAGLVCFDGQCVTPNDGTSESDRGAAPEAPATCEAPPTCDNAIDADGTFCRTCPVTLADGTEGSETLCLSPSRLRCAVESEGTSADAGTDPAAEQGRTCIVCSDVAAGVEVYRDCEGNGSVPPPVCVTEAHNGGSCSVCYDAVDASSVVYSTCPDVVGGETCYGVADTVLVGADGAVVDVDGADALVSCKQCGDTNAVDKSAFLTSCALTNVCADPYGSSFAPSACPATESLVLLPNVCGNPWDAELAALTTNGVVDDRAVLEAVIAYLLDVHGIAIAGARVTTSGDDAACALDDCTCADGTRIELLVASADVAGVQAALTR